MLIIVFIAIGKSLLKVFRHIWALLLNMIPDLCICSYYCCVSSCSFVISTVAFIRLFVWQRRRRRRLSSTKEIDKVKVAFWFIWHTATSRRCRGVLMENLFDTATLGRWNGEVKFASKVKQFRKTLRNNFNTPHRGQFSWFREKSMDTYNMCFHEVF